ncbi:MAG: hypothetical protein Q8N99_06705 [Nanoarchaeota archaeon]|nr:hypothetical protein [Nanoarchaeota archaeon]
MKIVRYFVPESGIELESLVGKRVGVKIVRDSSVQVMVHSGAFDSDRGKEYEFLQQQELTSVDYNPEDDEPPTYHEPRATDKIRWWRSLSEHVGIEGDGINLCSCCRKTGAYTPQDDQYDEKLRYLRVNKMWKEVRG